MSCVVVVVIGPATVDLPDPLYHILCGDVVFLHTAGHTVLQRSVNEHLQALRPLPKNVVAAPAYDDTGALVRQLPDNLRLGKEGLKADGDALLGIGGDADPDGGEGQVEAASGPLLRPGDELRGEAALFRGLLDQCAVIAWDPQPSGQPFADEPSAAAEFTADRNDIVTHIWHASCLESSKPPKPRFRRNSSSSTLYYSVFSEK